MTPWRSAHLLGQLGETQMGLPAIPRIVTSKGVRYKNPPPPASWAKREACWIQQRSACHQRRMLRIMAAVQAFSPTKAHLLLDSWYSPATEATNESVFFFS